jgi:hypothetical protein
MRLDRDDMFPLSVILVFGFAIPLSVWLGLGTRSQIFHDLQGIAKEFAIVSVCLALLVAGLTIHARRRNWRLLRELGEQTASDFAALFTTESEQRAAHLLFGRLRSMTATGRVPTLQKEDELSHHPLFLDETELSEQLQQLCEQQEIFTALDRDSEGALYRATTVGQVVSALARFIDQQ